jgi:hypothetical protein
MNTQEGKPPMMTHVFQNKTTQNNCCQRSSFAILKVSHLSETKVDKIQTISTSASRKGYRILGVAKIRLIETKF